MKLLKNNSLPKLVSNPEKANFNNLSYHAKKRPIFNHVKFNKHFPTTRFTVNIPSFHHENGFQILSPFYSKNHHHSPGSCQCQVHRIKRMKLVKQLQKEQKCDTNRNMQIKKYQDKIIQILRSQHTHNTRMISQQKNQIMELNVQNVKRIKKDYSLYISKRKNIQKQKFLVINEWKEKQKSNRAQVLKQRLDKMHSLDNHNDPFQEILLKRSMDEHQKEMYVKKVLGFLKWKSKRDNNFVKESKPYIQNYLKPIFKKMQIQQIIELTKNSVQDSNQQNNYFDPIKIQKISFIMNTYDQKTIQVLNDIKIVLQQLKLYEEEDRKQRQNRLKSRIQELGTNIIQNNLNKLKDEDQNLNSSDIINNQNTESKFLIQNQRNFQSQNKKEKRVNIQTKSMKNSKSSKNNKNKRDKAKQNDKLQHPQNEIENKLPFFQDWMLPKQVKKKQISQKYRNIKYQQYCTRQTFEKLALNIDDTTQQMERVMMIYNSLDVNKLLFQEEIIQDLIGQFAPMFTNESLKLFRQVIIKNRTRKLLQKLNRQIDQGINHLKKQKAQYEQNYIQQFQLPHRKCTQQSITSRYSNQSYDSINKQSIPPKRFQLIQKILRISTQIMTQQKNIVSQKDIDESIPEVKDQQNYYSCVVHEHNKENYGAQDYHSFFKFKLDHEKLQKQKQILKYMKKNHNKMFQKLNQSLNSLSDSLVNKNA